MDYKLDKKKNILIAGFYGAGNIGDDLILDSIIGLIKKNRFYKHLNIAVMAKNPLLVHDYKNKNIKIKSKSVLESPIMISQTQMLIIGGGGLFVDSIKPLLYYSYLCFLGKIFRKRILILFVGTEKIKHRISKALLKYITASSEAIVVRDETSARLLHEINPVKKIICSTDISISRLKGCNSELDTQPKQDVLGVSLINRSITDLPMECINNICKLIDKCAKETEMGIWLFCMYADGGDNKMAEYVMERVENKSKVKKIRLKNYKELLHHLKGVKIALGMRYHFIITCALLNIPFVSIGNSVKISDLTLKVTGEKAFNTTDINVNTIFRRLCMINDNHISEKMEQKRRFGKIAKISEYNISLLDFYIESMFEKD